MEINLAGLGLSIIVLIFVAGQVIAHRWIRKVTNTYFFWLAVGILCFAWLVGFRFADAWKTLHEQLARPDFNPAYYDDAYYLSKAVLLDVCPFIGLVFPFSLIVDPTRTVSRALAPLALITGVFTILCDIPTNEEAVITATYIFIGTPANPCYFIMHTLNLVLAVGVLLNTPRYGWKGYLIAVGSAILYYSYVGIMIGATGIKWFVSGLSLNDWSLGEYSKVAQFLHCSPLVAACVGLPAMFCIASGGVALNDYVFKKGWWTFGNAKGNKWYKRFDYNKFVVKKVW